MYAYLLLYISEVCMHYIIARFGEDSRVQVVIAQKSLFIVYYSPGDTASE